MAQLINKYYNPQALLEIATDNGIGHRFLQVFISLFEKVIRELEKDEPNEKDNVSSALVQSLDIIKTYMAEVQKGHGEDWAMLYADSVEEPCHAFNEAYLTLKQSNPELAMEELKIHTKLVGGNELYTRHFIFLMENGEGTNEPDRQAAIFAKVFAEQIKLGKTEVFAQEYADAIATNDWTEIACYAYADAYDRALGMGKTNDYARIYADRYSELVGNRYSEIGELQGDNDFQFFHDHVIAFMKAWEYLSLHQVSTADSFFALYEQEYLNTYHKNGIRSKEDEEMLDKIVLSNTLEKFSRKASGNSIRNRS